MQVKKFEAPTLQEALDTIKRELGPEAIILQTKQNRRGFGLMSKGSVEVTAAVSERSTEKKKQVERRLPEAYVQKMTNIPATKQADFYDHYLEKKIEREKVQLSQNAQNKRITAVRYADIQDDEESTPASVTSAPVSHSIQEIQTPSYLDGAMEDFSNNKTASLAELREEVSALKKLVEEIRKDRSRPEYLDSDSPYAATAALSEAYDLILQSGIERRFAVQIMREVSRNLGVEARAEYDRVLDAVAEQLLNRFPTKTFFGPLLQPGQQEIRAFVGASGVGKTALIAKLATHASRHRQEKVGVIRIQLEQNEGMDPLVIFAKALHIPYRAVNHSEELLVAIQDMSQCGRIFIDTPGVSSRDPSTLRRLSILLASASGIKVELVMSAITRDLEAHQQAKAYEVLKPDSLMFTRFDEAFSFGSLFSISRRMNLPASVFSTGKKVTEQWENASAERLTASILNIL